MTGSDLIVVAPWIVFAVALTIVWFLLRRSARAPRRGPGRPVPPSGPADRKPRRGCKRADREDNRRGPHETQCPTR